ncbi:MAG: YCF48-related protein [Planctomycetales bacterium]|jgi:photosystem II stability/assembly factor-like uncharacterized protein
MNRTCLTVSLCVIAAVFLRPVSAQKDQFTLTQQTPIHPWKDDAALHAVAVLGKKVAWAVGDHGTVWQTSDGGELWNLLQVPADCSLRSACFLSKRVGEGRVGTSQIAWLAGRATRPYTRSGYGVILKTIDGGKSWLMLGNGQVLPPLNYVRFFGTDEGVAVGEATPDFPTGVLTTQDGGETWQPAPGKRTAGWHAAAFTELHDGIVTGPRGRVSLVAGTNVAPPRLDASSLRGIRAVASADGLTAWAVGDGATVLASSNGGVSWEALNASFPLELSRFVDFAAVSAVNDKVWVAGNPGGCVWHSRDGGASWTRQATGHSAPIHALNFSTEETGFAVGAFGTILRTTDGGSSWNVCRAGRRRAAILAIHTRPERIPFGMLAKQGGDEGFRTVAIVVPRRDASAETDLSLERQMHDAVTTVGGSGAGLGWRLPIALPGVDTSVDLLTAEWQKHTEGKLVEVVVSNLVAAIRTWRPSVVVVEEPGEDDAAAKLILDAVKRAVAEAADSTSFIEHQEYARLGAWKVKRVFARASSKTRAGMTIDPYDVLPRLGTTVEAAASAGRAKLMTAIEHAPQSEPFIPIETDESRFALVSHRNFWAGIALSPNSDARRPQLPMIEGQLEKQKELAIRQRNFRGISEKYVDDKQKSSQLLAELRNVVRGMPARQAALQIAHLASDYRRRSQWDLAEATFIELIDRYPNEPVAAEAMLWLLHLWSSSEMAWHRSRGVQMTASVQQTSRYLVNGRIQRLLDAARKEQSDPLKTARVLQADPLADLELVEQTPSQDAQNWQTQTQSYWRQQAIQMGQVIRQRLPEVYPAPAVTWPLASVIRREGHARISESILRKHVSADPADQVGLRASAELWVTQPVDEMPKNLGYCTWATIRPRLDGVLGDECWVEARELLLSPGDRSSQQLNADPIIENKAAYPSVMLSHDDQFLYIAATLPRDSKSKFLSRVEAERGNLSSANTQPTVQFEGRTHDADLTGFDRLEISLDTDRDYSTAYEIEIDERGQVRESCWEDTTWNPEMWVHVDSEPTRWRIEMAIPFNALGPSAPKRQAAWAVSIVRTIPATGWQAWPKSAVDGHGESKGLVQFR